MLCTLEMGIESSQQIDATIVETMDITLVNVHTRLEPSFATIAKRLDTLRPIAIDQQRKGMYTIDLDRFLVDIVLENDTNAMADTGTKIFVVEEVTNLEEDIPVESFRDAPKREVLEVVIRIMEIEGAFKTILVTIDAMGKILIIAIRKVIIDVVVDEVDEAITKKVERDETIRITIIVVPVYIPETNREMRARLRPPMLEPTWYFRLCRCH